MGTFAREIKHCIFAIKGSMEFKAQKWQFFIQLNRTAYGSNNAHEMRVKPTKLRTVAHCLGTVFLQYLGLVSVQFP